MRIPFAALGRTISNDRHIRTISTVSLRLPFFSDCDLIREGVQKRGFPAAGRSHDGEKFASVRLPAYPLNDLCLPDGTGNILRVKNTKINAHNRADTLTPSSQNSVSTSDMLRDSSSERRVETVHNVQQQYSLGSTSNAGFVWNPGFGVTLRVVGDILQTGLLFFMLRINAYNSGALKFGACSHFLLN